MDLRRIFEWGAAALVGVLFLSPILALAARTAAPVLTGLFSSTTLSVNLPAPVIALPAATGTGAVYSNGGATMYFVVTALDGVGESVVSNIVGTSTGNDAHGWNITWTPVQGASQYRVWFSTTTPLALLQYFKATTTSAYNFTSTSSPTFSTSLPTANTAYAINLTLGGTSWLNGGQVQIGTTTNWKSQVTIASSTGPQLLLTDLLNNAWAFRAVGGSLFLATSTPTATSTNPAAWIINNKGNLTITSTNAATSSIVVGCMGGFATSTATPVHLVFSDGIGASSGATTTFGTGTMIGLAGYAFGACP